MAIEDAHVHAGTTNLTETWTQLISQHGQTEARPDNRKNKTVHISNISYHQIFVPYPGKRRDKKEEKEDNRKESRVKAAATLTNLKMHKGYEETNFTPEGHGKE